MPDADGNIKGISVPELPWKRAGLVSELTRLQRAINAEYARMTPKERGEADKRNLEAMPGQRYLFEPDA